jgi:hypothetical protein
LRRQDVSSTTSANRDPTSPSSASYPPRASDAELRAGFQFLFPQLHDPRGEIAAGYGVDRTPTWFFLDGGHRIRAKIVGVPSEGEIAALRLAGE